MPPRPRAATGRPVPDEAAELPREAPRPGRPAQGTRKLGKPAKQPKQPKPGKPERHARPARSSRPGDAAVRPGPPPSAGREDVAELANPAMPVPSPDASGWEPQGPGRSRWSTGLLTTGWLLLTLAGLAAVVAGWTTVAVPALVPQLGSVVVTASLALGLSVRTGGRPLIAGALALVLAGSAVASGQPVLLAGAAVCTAVLGALLGVMATTPAAGFPVVVRESLVAVAVAVAAAFAANGYDARLSLDRAGYLVLGLSMLGALVLVYRLGAGLTGLGTRGVIMVAGGVGLLAVTLAYTEALSRWGPPGLVGNIEQATDQVRAAIGAMPRPTEFLVGFPVLAWGVFSRARRRQGWWGAGFGAAGLAAVATTLLDPRMSLFEFGLGLFYNLVLGLSLGLLLIRTDIFLSGARGRRARQAEEAAAHRPEPGRLHPLL